MADQSYDITAIDAPDDQYDGVICFHVLEHVENDHSAISELYRVLKPGGTAFIQTPFKTGETYEDFSIVSPADRLKHFGQEDHVRIYSVSGLKERLGKVGFQVDVRLFPEGHVLGLKENETILICKKPT